MKIRLFHVSVAGTITSIMIEDVNFYFCLYKLALIFKRNL